MRVIELIRPDQRAETLRARREFAVAQMPFASEEIGVARVAHCFGDGDFLQRQVIGIRCAEQFAVAMPAEKIRDVDPRRILAGHDARARRRTNAARRVSRGEAHPAFRQPVEHRRLVELAAITAEIHPAEIIGQNKDDVRLACRFGRREFAKQNA